MALPPKTHTLLAGPAALLVVSATVLYATGGMTEGIDDVLELVAAVLAAVSCGIAARRSHGRLRWSWAGLCAASAAWALGEAVWTAYEVGLSRETPFPSVADLGFLAFPVGACVALLAFPANASRSDRRRMTFDGLTTAVAITLISWSTALGAVFGTTEDTLLATVVSLAYPVTDLALLVVSVLVLSRARGHRRVLGGIAGGLALMSVADSAFAYKTALGTYGEGDLLNLGWYYAFLLLTVTPLLRGACDSKRQDETESVANGLLPYVPLTLAAAVEIGRYAGGHRPGLFEACLCGALMALVLVRQALTVHDNKRLAESLTERERQLRHQAFHDALTGLANRALYLDRVKHALDLHGRDARPVSVLYLDLDGFKRVNDTMGHAAGDELLTQVAKRFSTVLGPADTLARLGGDEFAALLEDCDNPVAVGHELLAALAPVVDLTYGVAEVSTSIGVAHLSHLDATPTVDELLSRADLAMYTVKRRGKSGVLLHTPGLALDASDGGLAIALGAALANNETHVAYQPIIEPATGRIDAVEALARWEIDGASISPEVFVPVAEDAGLLDQLFLAVLDDGLSRLGGWSPTLRLAVNVSPRQLVPALVTHIDAALAHHGVDPQRLVLELTETAGLSDATPTKTACEQLRALGVRLSVDDFGTGSSTLARLRDLPVDEVKIDRSFVSRIDTDVRCQRFVRAVLAFAEELDLVVVAEGVEHTAQRKALATLGCHLAQGYLYSSPVAPGRIDSLLAAAVPAPTTSPETGTRTRT